MDLLFDKRRYGRFLVSNPILNTGVFPDIIRKLGITIVRAEMDYARDAVEYIGVCPSFDILPSGSIAPLYEITATKTNDEYEYKVERITRE